MMCGLSHKHNLTCYKEHGCRCDSCRDALSESNKRARAGWSVEQRARRLETQRNWYHGLSVERKSVLLRKQAERDAVRRGIVFEGWQLEIARKVFGK